MDIADPYLAYCFDSAVNEFGAHVSSELGEIDGKDAKVIKAKQEYALKALLGDTKEQFAAPVATTDAVEALKDF